ncbi:amidohydrolase family protein [Curtobacterium sp. SORGH_AS_0776]|uniref:metal-dependent hydrolase family protein n=1 Tax=Curtobacterium sp. SORGH_AS_0776 TaxID=3041798 RepID=UPI00285A9570|nr:amidohydrolase family protein [Curtobacterium sp. SORGH_AS_0776]MDR6169936.1 imidazolonepropionase-like amidohydrolase [Curtobacterium sp. SORGH_AS_0776]
MAARLPTTPHAPGVLRLVGATLVDGTGAPPRADAEVELRDGVVTYAGPRRPPAAGIPVADLTGTWLLPGFVDTHVHLSMVPTAPEEQRGRFPEEDVLEVAEVLRSTLDAGVTTARDLDGLTPGYRNAVARGTVTGPRLHLAIAMLSPTGGHADPVRPNGSLPAWAVRSGMPEPGVVDTDDDIVRTVRALLRTGADAIKVSTSGGVGSPTDDPDDVGITEEQVRLVVRLVRERGGRPVTAHALTDAAARAAVLGGASSIEHGYALSDETIALMVERGTVLVPTLSTLLRELDPATASEERLRHRAALHERGLDSVRRALAAGVPVALGTDAGVHPHGRNLAELARLVQVGLSPLAAVTAGTLQGARLLGLEARLGSVEPGKEGDLVVTRVDPLTDVGALADAASVRAVLQSGRVVKDLDGLVTTAS